MPWQHCGRTMMDDQRCGACGITKPNWTLKLDKTRTFALSKKFDGAPEEQAEALREAAKDGAPFCEKCEEYKREQEAAQAKALQDAAEEGTPFCEKCDEAQKEQDRQEAEAMTSAT